jgi:serine protease Do
VNKIRSLICGLVAAGIILVSGCSSLLPAPPIPSPAPLQPAPAASRVSAVNGTSLPSFADLTSLVQPSVVAVNTETVVRNRFIQRSVQGAGSGWVFDESGVIVTNNHVVQGARTITVQTSDGKSYTPVSVKTDPSTDLAVLRINAGRLPALKIADTSGVRVGDWVLAIGNALGMGIGVKNGIISRLGVSIQGSASEAYNNLIETNAAINPGNSGGPLVNLSGEVVGITSLKLSTSGVEGMGYAINISDALPVIQRLMK